MKKLISFITASVVLFFTSCLDSEEKITLNEDGSGTYVITMDMAKMMGMLSAFGGENKKAEKKDTVIYFKDYTDTSSVLTAEEKEILHNGKLAMNMDSEKGELKVVMDAAFKNASQLTYLRANMQDMLNKSGAMNKLNDKKNESEDSPLGEMGPKMNPGKSNANPFKEYYEFNVTGNSLIYTLKDKAAALKAMETNEDMKMMKQMAPMMGDMTFSTVIALPREAKKAEGQNAKLSADKKTVTVTTSLKQVIDDLEAMSFSVAY